MKIDLFFLKKYYKRDLYANYFLFIIGSLVNLIAYFSLNPFFTFLIYIILGRLLLLLFTITGFYELKIYYRVALVGWLMSGISAIYVTFFKDNYQIFSDAGSFFYLSINNDVSTVSIIEIQDYFENALPIYIWNTVYNFFSYLGFPKERYIGILFNTISVAISGVFTVKIARIIFCNDIKKLRLLMHLFSFCGLFWLFSSIHLRDSLVLLFVTIITYFWIFFLCNKTTLKSIFLIIVINLFAFIFFRFLRVEFTFVPIAFLLAAMFSKYFTQIKNKDYYLKSFLILIFLFFLILLTINFLGNDLWYLLVNGLKTYNDSSDNSSSLGNALIVNQIWPIKLILGFIYLFIFPIPFWSGLQLESSYHLFLSFNVIYFYFLTPLFILSTIYFFKYQFVNRLALFFIFLVSIGFTFAIALTSLETRHFACFLPSILIFSLIPDLEKNNDYFVFKSYFLTFLLFVLTVHLLWLILKVVS